MRPKDTDDDRSFVSNARRAQIVEAAIETLADVGYANASLARIAVRLGISKGVISYHFSGKDDLIAEIVSQVLQRARAYMQPRRSYARRSPAPRARSLATATGPSTSSPNWLPGRRRSPS
jgi:AcrR family transcriptional regulator